MDLRLLGARAQQDVAGLPFREWAFPDGAPSTKFYRTEAGYLLRFLDFADFMVAGGDLAVTCRPVPGVTVGACRQLFLNQVLPLLWSKQGRLVFHASAVDVAGRAAAFVAGSGRGKSTLAASFAASGCGFLTDDGLAVAEGEGGFQVEPSHPSVRLWEDSRAVFAAAGMASDPAVQYGSKARLLAGRGFAYCGERRPLARAYFLGEDRAAAVTFERISPAAAALEWVKNSFLLDLEERPLLAAHFDRVASLANQVACYRLNYPRRFEDLPGVRDAIVRHLTDAKAP